MVTNGLNKPAGAALLLLLLLSGCRPQKGADQMLSGRDMYGQKCLSCHGADGNGSKVYPHALKYRDVIKNQNAFLELVKEGVSGTVMPSWKYELTDSEIERLRQFLLSIK
jgi:mono/diheme cytochrome c family protein